MTTPTPADALTPEEQVIREWVAAMTRESGAPLPSSLRRAEPLPRRRVLPVVQTLLDIIDELRAERGPLIVGTDDSPEWRAALSLQPEVSVRPGLREAARTALDEMAYYLWSEDDSGDENRLVAAHDSLRAALAESPVTPDLEAEARCDFDCDACAAEDEDRIRYASPDPEAKG